MGAEQVMVPRVHVLVRSVQDAPAGKKLSRRGQGIRRIRLEAHGLLASAARVHDRRGALEEHRVSHEVRPLRADVHQVGGSPHRAHGMGCRGG
jgi:hypothetical protein